MGLPAGSYNVVLSDKELDIDKSTIAVERTKTDIKEQLDFGIELMMKMIYIFIVLGVVLCMTSNIGSSYLMEGIDRTGKISDKAREQVMAELRMQFRPEFLNRVDDIIFFKPLNVEEIGGIVHLMIEELKKRLEDHKIAIQLTQTAVDYIVREGFDPVYGARPLRRFIQQHIETLIARSMIGGEIMGQIARHRQDKYWRKQRQDHR